MISDLQERSRWALHFFLLALLATAFGFLFLQEPGFGDDLTYWSFGYDLHQHGLIAWGPRSFHDLRWPVWGWCWLIQACGGIGMVAYTGVAVIYQTFGSWVAFAFGRLLSRSIAFAWTCALAFLFCPLIDNVCHRPMPDLSEGVFAGLAMLLWWRLMHASTTGRSVAWAALLGLTVFVMQANRLTGVFIAPVLGVVTIIFAHRRFGWLVAAGAFCVVFYAMEAAFYHWMFKDWMHSLHANMNGKGNKGTGNIPFLTSPFRFLDTLWREARLSPLYCILALLGIWSFVGRRRNAEDVGTDTVTLQKPISLPAVIGVWFLVHYLMYCCFPQSLNPWSPVIRDAGRFLAGLSMPLSLLAVLGLRFLFGLPFIRSRKFTRWITEHPVSVGTAVSLILIGIIGIKFGQHQPSRPFFDLGFVAPMRTYVRSLPEGTKVFTHHMMRNLSILAEPTGAQKIKWLQPREIIQFDPKLEKMASQADEFWYMRKIVWMNTRKKLEKDAIKEPFHMASYLENPEKEWALSKLMVKGDGPDLVFYRRRTPTMEPPLILNADSPELAGFIPPLPATWHPDGKSRAIKAEWKVPPALRGKCLVLKVKATADTVEPAGVTLQFNPVHKEQPEILLKPYTFAEPTRDFFVIPVPPDAETCSVRIRFAREVKTATLTEFQMVIQSPLDGL